MFDPRSLPVPFRLTLDEDDDDTGKGGSGGKSDKDDAGKKKTEGSDDKPDLAAEVDKWKSLARKHETNAKANADKAKKFDEFEEASKTELQRAADKAAEAEARAAEAEQRALRIEVAHAKGLTPAQAKRLVGSTKEELESDADELLETFASNGNDDDSKKPPSRKPSERLKSGRDPERDSDDDLSDDEFLKAVPRI